MAMRISLGSGATLATNLLNGEHLQIISPVTVNPLPAGAAFIGLASVFGTVNVSGGSIFTNWNSGATVSVTGTVAATQSGTWNAGITGLISLASGTNVGLNAGTNNIGDVDVASIAAGDNNIGNVDVVTLPALATGANYIGLVTVANTITETNSGAIKTAVETIDNAISGSEMQVDVVTMPTTTVTATNLDIRDLSSSSDSIAATQSGTWNTGITGLISLASGTLVGLNPSSNHIGSVSIFGSITANTGMTTLFPGPNQIGSVTISNIPAVTQSGTWNMGVNGLISLASGTFVSLNAGTTHIGSVSIFGSISTTAGAVTLYPGPNQIGSVTVSNIVAVTQSGTWDEVGINDSGNSITIDGTVTADLGATDNAVLDAIEADTTTLAGAVSGTEMQVDVLTMPTVTVTATNLDVQSGGADLATTTQAGAIQTAVQLLDDTVFAEDSGHTTADKGIQILAVRNDAGTALAGTDLDYIPLGTNSVGSLRVNEDNSASIKTAVETLDNAIHVDDAAYTLGTHSGVMMMGFAGTQSVNANDAGAVAMETDGSVHIHDGGNTITVDGTVTANLSGTDNTVLDNIDADTSAIQTATELIDDTVFVDDADWTADTSKHILVGGVTQVATTVNTDGDVTPLTTNAFRELRTAIPESDLATAGTAHVKKYYTSAGAATDGIIWSPAAGKRWYITDIFINVSAAATVTLEDDKAGGDEAVWKAELAANSGWSHSFKTPWYSGEDAADLIITTTAGNVYVTCTGYEI